MEQKTNMAKLQGLGAHKINLLTYWSDRSKRIIDNDIANLYTSSDSETEVDFSDTEIESNTESWETQPNSVFILDWDDTLLPTTYILQREEEEETLTSKDFVEIDTLVVELLENLTSTMEKVIIITNAMNFWVEESSEMYLPKTHKFLEDSSIEIFSARHYEHEYPENMLKWKKNEFKTRLSAAIDSISSDTADFKIGVKRKRTCVQRTPALQLFSVGDSLHDLQALAKFECSNAIKKNVKLCQRPDLAKLKLTLQKLGRVIPLISEINCSIDLEIR